MQENMWNNQLPRCTVLHLFAPLSGTKRGQEFILQSLNLLDSLYAEKHVKRDKPNATDAPNRSKHDVKPVKTRRQTDEIAPSRPRQAIPFGG
jgi:hypothetical protein